VKESEREHIFASLSERLGRKRHESLKDAAERIVVTAGPGVWQDPRVLKAAIMVLDIKPTLVGEACWRELRDALQAANT
jgi:hypothetical protein